MKSSTQKLCLTSKILNSKSKPGGFLCDVLQNKALYLMLLPGTILVFIFSYLPMAGVMIAFKNLKFYGNIFQSFIKSEWVGLRYFNLLFSGPNILHAVRNTLLYNTIFIFGGVTLSVTLAICLSELRSKLLAKFYHTLFLMPYFFSWVVISYFVYAIFSIQDGIANNILQSLGLERRKWYFEPGVWPYILISAHFWRHLGFSAIVYLAAITGIDQEYYDAAQIDGASKFQQIKNITLPMLTPTIVILTILAVGRIFNADFGLFFHVPRNAGNIRATTEVFDTYVYRLMKSGDFGFATAANLVQSIVGFFTIMTANMIVRKVEPDYSLF